RLLGNGDKGVWTAGDLDLHNQLGRAVSGEKADWDKLAQRLAKLRLQPLTKHLKGVRHLIILATPMHGLPIERLTQRYPISYGASGSIYAHSRSLPTCKHQGMLALADPIFKRPKATHKKPLLPPDGLLLLLVNPAGNAARAGLQIGDVLLKCGDKQL